MTGFTPDGNPSQTGNIAWGGAIYGFSSTVEISNNIFLSNIAQGGPAFSNRLSGTCSNRNGGSGDGGAIYVSGSGKIVNNTFYGNSAVGGAGGSGLGCTGNGGNGTAGAIKSFSGITIANNIFVFNSAAGGTGSTVGTGQASTLSANGPTITNNLFFGNAVSGAAGDPDTTGTSVLTSNPLFTLAPTNLQITSVSPAKAAGTATGAPVNDFAGTTRPSPPAIVAYEPAAAFPSTNPKINPILFFFND